MKYSTLTDSAQAVVDFGGSLGVQGELSTTNSDGSPTCIENWSTANRDGLGVYYGPVFATTVQVHYTSSSEVYTGMRDVYYLPDLSKNMPPLAAWQQCSYIFSAAPPLALTPMNQIELPAKTLPLASPTSTKQSSPTSTAAQPGSSGGIILPASTSTVAPSSTIDGPDSNSSPPNDARLTSAQQSTDPERTLEAQSGGDQIPSSNDQVEGSPDTAHPSSPAQASGSPSRSPEDTVSSIQIVAIDSVDIIRLSSRTIAAEGGSSIQDVGAIDSVGDDSNAYVVGSRTTISANGPPVTIAGTVYSALPSGSGIIAAEEDSADEFASYINVGISGEQFSPEVDDAESNRDVPEALATLVHGQQAATISGTTFSVLPSRGGVIAVANERSTIISAIDGAATPSTPPLVASVEGSSNAFAIRGTVTISAGGSAASVSGTTYSALSSGHGLVVMAEGVSTTWTNSASAQSVPIRPTSAYIVGGVATISAGGSAAAISGTTYSALPSGGVFVAADGTSSSRSPDEIMDSDPTGSLNEDDNVVPFTGEAFRMAIWSIAAICWALGAATILLFE